MNQQTLLISFYVQKNIYPRYFYALQAQENSSFTYGINHLETEKIKYFLNK